MTTTTKRLRRYAPAAIALLGGTLGLSSPSAAGVQQLVIDSTSTATYTPVGGQPTSYTIYTGRVFGTLHPSDKHNEIIQDIKLAPTTKGDATYIANFEIVTPTDAKAR